MLVDVAMNTIPSIFDSIGGPSKFARALGLKQSAASEMKRRKSIPVVYWPVLIDAMKASGKSLTYEDLVQAHQRDEATQ